MFTAAQFTISKPWRQPKCPLIDKWIKNMWNRSSCHGSVVMNPTSIHEDTGLISGLAQQVEDPSLQTWLGSGVAVAVVYSSSCSSDLTPSWEPLYAKNVALKD